MVAPDGAAFSPANNFRKTGSGKHGFQAGVDESIRQAAVARRRRVTFDDVRAVSKGKLDSRLQQGLGYSQSPRLLGDEEADHRPDGLVVKSLQHPRPL